MIRFGEKVYKVTATDIGKTKRNFGIYKIQLNNEIWATKLIPLRKLDKKFSQLYQLYLENNNSLDFLMGKYQQFPNIKRQTNYTSEWPIELVGDEEAFSTVAEQSISLHIKH